MRPHSRTIMEAQKKKETKDDNTNLTIHSWLIGRGTIGDSYAEILIWFDG